MAKVKTTAEALRKYIGNMISDALEGNAPEEILNKTITISFCGVCHKMWIDAETFSVLDDALKDIAEIEAEWET